MKSQNHQVLAFLERTLSSGQPAWLVTILSVWGSSPRPVGSLLAVGPEQHCGSLSGGCLEEKLLEELRAGHYGNTTPQRISIGVSQEQAREYRLPCGGQMRLLAEPIQPYSPAHLAYRAALAALDNRQPCTRSVMIDTGEVSILADTGAGRRDTIDDQPECMTHRLGPGTRLLLVGANLVAEQLASLADGMEMEVWICDPRPDAFAQWPHAFTHNTDAYPDDLIRQHFQSPSDIIITLAHDPRVDDMALMEALISPAAYIGALGSQRTTAQRLARLRALDLDEAALARLHAPVGLDIGSKTPLEIAIAIAAGLIAFREQRTPRQVIT